MPSMRRDLYEIKDSAASITMGLGNVAVNLVAKAMQLAIFGAIYRFRIFTLNYQWWAWGAFVLLRRVQLLLVPSRQPRMPAILGIPRGASLVATRTICRRLCAKAGRGRS